MKFIVNAIRSSTKMFGSYTAPVSRGMCSTVIPATDKYNYQTLKVSSPSQYVAHVEFNRMDRLNAFNRQMWIEIKKCFEQLHSDANYRAIVLSGGGSKHFTAGIDLLDMMALGQQLGSVEDVARRARLLEDTIKLYQDSMSSLEKCYKPVIVAVHSACIGAGVNLITAADIRYCSRDAWFSLKEVDIGMAADVGALQRLPRVIGNHSLVRELSYTARKMPSDEAFSCGLVSRIFDNREEMTREALKMAELIASKSPLAVQSTKKNLIYSGDHTVQEGLDHIREINMMNLQSEDLLNAVMASQTKEQPVFAKL